MQILIDANAKKIFQFKPNYNLDAATQQAERRKLDAFGMFAKIKFWDKPKEEEIIINQKTLQYEPFWHCLAERRCQYTKNEHYSIKTKSQSAIKIELAGKLIPSNNNIFIVDAIEHCSHTNKFDQFFPGLSKQEKSLDIYRKKFGSMLEQLESIDASICLEPQQRASLIIQTAVKNITIPFDADNITEDTIEISSLHLYYKPVYNFEFSWPAKGSSGIIQIDGLTGDVVAQSDTRIQKIASKIITRDNIFDLGGEIAGSIVPGGSAIVKAINIVTKEINDDKT
ncbi:MAG: hypothetical protein RLY71_3091 [Pseudomonadota bacterium]|jgi:hypothetical protein